MDANQAKATVDRVAKDIDTASDENAQVKALDSFRNNLKEQMKDMSVEDQKYFMAKVVQDLTDRNILPVLALAYAKQADGDLDEKDLNADKRFNNSALREGNQAKQLEMAMLKYLTDNYSSLVVADNEWLSDNAITAKDVSAMLKILRDDRDEGQRVNRNHKAATESARMLLGGGQQSLFNYIDRNSKDGLVSKAELEQYLADHKASGVSCNDDNSHFSNKKVAFVTQLLASWDDRNGTKWLRGGYKSDDEAANYLTKQGLVESAGKSKEAELIAAPREKTMKVDETTRAGYGEGYWQIAERLLKAKGKYTTDDIAREYNRLKEINNNKELKTGVPVKTGEVTINTSEIKSVVQSGEVEVQRGDSYWSIARRVMGKDASTESIRLKAVELQKKNNNQALIWNQNSPMKIKA